MTNRLFASNVELLAHEIFSRARLKFHPESSSEQLRQANTKLRQHLSIRTAQWKLSNARLQQSRELSVHLGQTLEDERTRIAREIHDQLGQLLTAIKMDVGYLHKRLGADSIDIQQLQDKATATMAVIDDTIETMRHIASDLRPAVLDDLGLVAALEWHAQKFQTRMGVRCEVTSDLLRNPERDVATALFRIVQEALTNVSRHAQATQVHITLIEQGGVLTLEVRDNGKGISESDKRASKSFGLLGIGERARLLGGTAEVTSELGKGTTVTVKIPIVQAAAKLT